jgi:transcriptional regulator PpsR
MPLGTQQQLTTGHFASPSLFFDELNVDAAANLIAAAADVVLIIDGAGVIRDLAVSNDELLGYGYPQWVGQPWVQTVTVESKPKVEAMLREVGSAAGRKWRHVNHHSVLGADLPLSYSVAPVFRRNASNGLVTAHTVAFGRDLRAQVALQQRLVSAQLSMERDYWKLRHAETRYRMLFQLASEAVLILDGSSEKLQEANPAAFALLGESAHRAGWTLAQSVDEASHHALQELFVRLRVNGRPDTLPVRLRNSAAPFTAAVSLFRQENATHLLLRLTPTSQSVQAPAAPGKQLLLAAVENAPDAFVLTELSGTVITANRAFLELAQVSNEDLVRGASLEKWLGRTGVDMQVLISNLRQRGAVRLFATSMRGEFGSIAEVEISAVAVNSGETPCLGFSIRDVGRRLGSDKPAGKELPRSASQMAELVGRVPMKDIVRETTDLIEQLCIEAALDLTGDNRASAAEMLGLSRQSLYVKLRRFGMGDTESN